MGLIGMGGWDQCFVHGQYMGRTISDILVKYVREHICPIYDLNDIFGCFEDMFGALTTIKISAANERGICTERTYKKKL